MFESLGRSIVDNLAGGFNCSVFAYGQTGRCGEPRARPSAPLTQAYVGSRARSGKSYTMMGTGAALTNGLVRAEDVGLIPRCCGAVFERGAGGARTWQVDVSYYEIYNERIRDLFRPSKVRAARPRRVLSREVDRHPTRAITCACASTRTPARTWWA